MPPSPPPSLTASPCTRCGSTSMARAIASTSLTSAPPAAAPSGPSVPRAATPTRADVSADTSRRPPQRPPPRPDRIRRITGGFAFVPNEFLHHGFFASLSHTERSLYFFLVLAGDPPDPSDPGGTDPDGRVTPAWDPHGARSPATRPRVDHDPAAPPPRGWIHVGAPNG